MLIPSTAVLLAALAVLLVLSVLDWVIGGMALNNCRVFAQTPDKRPATAAGEFGKAA